MLVAVGPGSGDSERKNRRTKEGVEGSVNRLDTGEDVVDALGVDRDLGRCEDSQGEVGPGALP